MLKGSRRDDKRYTEKKNKTERARRKKEDNTRLRSLVDMALSVDPRIKRIKEEEKEARAAKKNQKVNGSAGGGNAKQKAEEEKKRKEEEAKKAEEDDKVCLSFDDETSDLTRAQVKKAEAKKAKTAAANAAKKARRAARTAESETASANGSAM